MTLHVRMFDGILNILPVCFGASTDSHLGKWTSIEIDDALWKKYLEIQTIFIQQYLMQHVNVVFPILPDITTELKRKKRK